MKHCRTVRAYGFAGLLNHHLVLGQRHENELVDGADLPCYYRTVQRVLRDFACPVAQSHRWFITCILGLLAATPDIKRIW